MSDSNISNGSNNDLQVENTVIIGSGPSGFTAGLYTARANLSPLLITGNDYGGQVSITHEVENYPGFPESLSGPELVEKMKDQAEKFGTRVEFDYVTEIGIDRHPFVVRTQNGKEHLTQSIILSDGFFFRGKDVIVIGGGDSALEEGLFLTKFATRVRIIHRRDELRASKILQDRALKHEKIEFVWNTVITDIIGDEEGTVIGAKTQDTLTGAVGMLETDGVFIFIGHLPNNELFEGKLEMDEDGHLITDRSNRTNVPGVFAGGEIMDKVFKQVATSVGQGCSAAMQTEKFLSDLEENGYPAVPEDPREFVQAGSGW